MNLDNVSTVEELAEYIKWSIQTPGTLWDGIIMSDDEISRTAEGVYDLANAGGMKCS